MKRKTGFIICILTVCMICLSLCENTYAAAKKTSIKLNKSKATIYTSGSRTLQLKATVKGPSKKVTWKSSNKKVATVNSKGKVTAKKIGKVTITAKANGIISRCKISIKNGVRNTNVTKILSKDSDIKRISEMISNYTSCEMANRRSIKTVVERLSGANLLSIASYIGYKYYRMGEFSQEDIHNLTNNLFGKRPSVSLIPTYDSPKRKYIVQTSSNTSFTGKSYMYSGGDWGDSVPKYKIVRIVKTKSNTYKVTIKNILRYGNTKRTKRIGTTTFTIKEETKSSLHYIIVNLSYKGTGEGYF